MTLILALASELEVHMTCDFKLTDARSGKVLSVDTHKLVSVHRPGLQAVVGATGLAVLGGKGVFSWVAERTGTLDLDATFDDLIEALSGVSRELDRVHPAIRQFRHLSLVIGALQGSQSVIALISNFQDIKGDFLSPSELPAAEMRVSVTRPTKPILLAAGERHSIRKDERKSCERMLRSQLEGRMVRERLAALNKRVAARVNTVSQGCYAASEYAVGNRGEAEPHLVEQTGQFIPPEFELMLQQMGLQLSPTVLPDGTAAPIQVRGSTSVGYSPSPAYFREQFKLRPDDSELWNNFGAYEDSQGRPRNAKSAFEQALRLKTDNYFAARNLGSLLWRTFGDHEAGKSLFEVALQEPDENHRRDTLSLLAENTALGEDGDLERAEQLFSKAMEGELLATVATRYALFLIDHRPHWMDRADEILTSVLQREPNFGQAIIGKVHAELRLDVPPDQSLERITAAANQFKDDVGLTFYATYVSLRAGNCKSAREFFERFRRIRKVAHSAVLTLGALTVLCEGGSLDDVVADLNSAGGLENEINLAIVAWARGYGEEHATSLGEVPLAGLPVGVRVEHFLVTNLLCGTSVSEIVRLASEQFKTAELRAFDLTVMYLVAKHPEVPEIARERLLNVISEMSHVAGTAAM